MVVLSVNQPRNTYLLWKRFSYPTDHGPQDAFSVPTWVANQLNSAYAIIVSMLMVEVWIIITAFVLFFFLKWQMRQSKGNTLHPVVPILWNNRGALDGSFMELSKYIKRENARPWVFVLLLLVLAAWVAQAAVSIVVPPLIILSNAAPVNPDTVYFASKDQPTNAKLTAAFALEVPVALRAAGNIESSSDLDKRVAVDSENLGNDSDGNQILRTNYSYNVTGVDFGLQKYPDLKLYVTGSCTTDYGRLRKRGRVVVNHSDSSVDIYAVDTYDTDGELLKISLLYNGPPPIAYFFPGALTKGTLEGSNTTWSAIISSVNRTSFSPSNDPWYLTQEWLGLSMGAAYMVTPHRPVLSCWEENIWSYKGRNSTGLALNTDYLPGLELSNGVQKIFNSFASRNLSMIAHMGQHLGSFALQSGLTSQSSVDGDTIFDAGSSSIQRDLQRIARIAFIATCSILTDSTLYPADAYSQADNAITSQDNARDFVVRSPNVSALSLKVIIALPSALLGSWLFVAVLLFATPVRLVRGLDSSSMFTFIQAQLPGFNPADYKANRISWQT
ncbi:hypothetical protein TARUN_4518 [Trichoderma arundinaceum]|uniref:Uncharacterized protein n=1 Tax=Trichoderma arundinaceum TaxID=490622 RepID=A0A395NP24_TRIAR|nr:hypothetical protein TARUN_4518 [Trichoderma arundinaceum]